MWGLILLLSNFSTREKARGVRVEPLPPSGRATVEPLFQWACRKSQLTTWRSPAEPRPHLLPPSQFATRSPRPPRRWGDRAVGGRVQNAMI